MAIARLNLLARHGRSFPFELARAPGATLDVCHGAASFAAGAQIGPSLARGGFGKVCAVLHRGAAVKRTGRVFRSALRGARARERRVGWGVLCRDALEQQLRAAKLLQLALESCCASWRVGGARAASPSARQRWKPLRACARGSVSEIESLVFMSRSTNNRSERHRLGAHGAPNAVPIGGGPVRSKKPERFVSLSRQRSTCTRMRRANVRQAPDDSQRRSAFLSARGQRESRASFDLLEVPVAHRGRGSSGCFRLPSAAASILFRGVPMRLAGRSKVL